MHMLTGCKRHSSQFLIQSEGKIFPKIFQNTNVSLKGLGHAISGNLSTDRMVIELTKISK